MADKTNHSGNGETGQVGNAPLPYREALERLRSGQPAEAIPLLRETLESDARNPEWLDALYAALMAAQDYEQAEATLRRAQALGVDLPAASLKLGLALAGQRQWEAAAEAYADAIKDQPELAAAHHHLGHAQMELGRAQLAADCFRHALSLNPVNPHTHAALAAALQQLGRSEEAMDHCQQALELSPDHGLAHFNLGAVLLEQGEVERSRYHLERAAVLLPESARVHAGLADLHHDRGKWDEAVAAYERALALDPSWGEARYNLAVTRLIRHEFAQAWPDYERRLDREGIHGQFRRDAASVDLYRRLPRWRGPSEEDGLEVAVWAEQGIGDQILFSTLIPELIASGTRFVYEVDPRLLDAYRRAYPDQRFVPIADPPRHELQQADRVLLAGSLPGYFRRDRGDFSRQPKALIQGLPRRVADVQARIAALGAGLKVALSWNSRRGGLLGLRKSAPLAEFAPLLKVTGVHFVDVQYGDTKQERDAVRGLTGVPLLHFDDVDAYNDLEGVLAILAACDLVVTTSNVTAHLAGALGKRTWLLYPAGNPPFHYWAGGTDARSLWYPSVEILTAPHLIDWTSLIECAVERMAREVARPGMPARGPDADEDANALAERARRLRREGQLDEARRAAIRALDRDRAHAGAWFDLGAVFDMAGRTAQSVEPYRHAIALRPDFAEAWSNLGGALTALGNPSGGLDAYRRATQANPGLAPVWSNLGSALLDAGEIPEAVSACRRAVELETDFAEAWSNLCNALCKAGDYPEAVRAGLQAVTLAPDMAAAWSNYGSALMEQGDIAASLAAHGQALSRSPDNAVLRYNEGLALERAGRHDAAADSYRRALAIRPDLVAAHVRLACVLLTRGDFAAGWAEYEWRWREAGAPRKRHEFAPWSGERVPGHRLLLWGEQGLGDELIYAGMVGDFAGSGMQLTLEVDPRLVTLMQRSFPGTTAVPRTDPPGIQALSFDSQAPLAALGRWLRPSFDAFPVHRGYLKADPQRAASFSRKLRGADASITVGISWRSVNREIGAIKSAGLEQWAALLRTPGVRFVDLQYGDTATEREALERQHAVRLTHLDELDLMEDVEGLAALCDACDLIITVSNVTAHMAGALGKPVWLLAPAANGRIWYWFHDREDSPWYPSMRIFTQKGARDWRDVLDRVSRALAARMRGEGGA